MIELMLEAERALGVGLLDQADRLYGQVVAADPRNSIAIVGLARVALERGDERGAYEHARRALALDPDNPMASHLVMRMGEIMRSRGEELPVARDEPAGGAASGPGASGQRRGIVTRLFRRGSRE
jgi:tetratricopeptide (TPR) repeat protein